MYEEESQHSCLAYHTPQVNPPDWISAVPPHTGLLQDLFSPPGSVFCLAESRWDWLCGLIKQSLAQTCLLDPSAQQNEIIQLSAWFTWVLRGILVQKAAAQVPLASRARDELPKTWGSEGGTHMQPSAVLLFHHSLPHEHHSSWVKSTCKMWGYFKLRCAYLHSCGLKELEPILKNQSYFCG